MRRPFCHCLLTILLATCTIDRYRALSLNIHQKASNLLTFRAGRRDFLTTVSFSSMAASLLLRPTNVLATSTSNLSELRASLKQARDQLAPIPGLIKEEKWDSVRAILITPPISDLWGKASSTKAVLQTYAEQLGDAGGDELAVLEAREELVSHLRYLDMAVYNNVFNPIATEGTSGATKELVRSYYEDPINEYKASLASLNEIISLSENL